jgi:hypothetical protein
MSENIEFANNYSDQSTDQGFQFEFNCNRCGKAIRTPFRAWGTATAANVLDGAASLLGGVFGRAADVGSRVRSATWERAHDDAFRKAAEEVRPQFIQCPRCQSWVCREDCLNEKRGLCKGCAPDLGVEMSAAQASRSVEEVWAHAAMAEEDKKLAKENWRETIRAACPKCEHPLEVNAAFCPSCGEKLKRTAFCAECGEKLTPDAKFCAGCGKKVGDE